ncbi:ATP-binding cassette domain-containing protein [Carnobacterium divergens]|uniref:ATP-binding cassette domain-containing protein n=1 Tax=Carnobacterium divergens TaxID=2748 RepID=UPI0029C97352|nr:ATP-binding cassette domain-containing protein [Carnobacterium divergens]
MNSQLFFYVVLMVLVYAIIFMIFLPFLKKNRKKYYSYYSESITALSQVLVGNSTILMQKSSLWFFDKISSKVKKANRKLYVIGWLEGAVSSLVTLTESMGSLAILWKGSQLALQGKISLGSLVVFQSMMTSFILPIQQLILIQNEIQTLRILTQRLDDLYEVKAERIALPIVNEEIVKNYNIKLNNISFSYHFGRNILENINCDISEGSKVGIVGNSGSGKTTLIKMIASLYSPTQGEIYFDNKSYEKYSLDELRQNIAYVDQTPFIFEGTILDNLIMGISLGDDNSKHIEKVAEICELYHLDSTDKNDLNMFLYENGNNLSGGQKQKIGLARALIKSPKLLLLDEATSNIDETSKLKILSYIYSLTKMTVISISHDKSIYNYSDYFLSVKPDGVRKISLIN